MRLKDVHGLSRHTNGNRAGNDVECGFSRLRSGLFTGIKGESDRKSAEGGLLVNFLSLRLGPALLNRMRSSGITDETWIPELMKVLRKPRINLVGDERRLNEVTGKQRELIGELGLPLIWPRYQLVA